ncbi:TPA: XRE family transcriptional regulator [Vibrio parahaemolyticus]|uniref:helix-turn-helix domain-containing protein n=1 Tax=Vibrio TaxID=662 RepID=UPI00111E02AE|nr:helix-turn-helix transcriptional regulator [Vibrio parahaemolyticus]MDF4941885.1 helix-turn-helix transcriptional regulator [Vibrio parahaemolyticus]TOK31882.1 transcriptional regulator [Vibrio parahaemolyticus]HCE3705908.1 XRE family transcriptional regulator [Vibrio parahaemolyticus]HCG6654719.1 XRE family transcriptional regulator [Vibrio parahaemolyticus]
MALKFYDSPFHVTHTEEIATKMALKMDLSIMITKAISKKGWTQKEAAEHLGLTQSRVSDLKNSKIEKFTIDAMIDILDKFGFRAKLTEPNLDEANILISKAVSA